jgi:hypothetical protein
MSARIRRITGTLGIATLLLGATACGKVPGQGRSPSLLVVESLQAASGATPGDIGVPLASDVQTLVEIQVAGVTQRVATFYNDVGEARLRIVLKDQGIPGNATSPSELNAVTVYRYHVAYRRADGRNAPGVDVPYPMDGAVTATIGGSVTTVPFEIVRSQAKLESPLRTLVGSGGRIQISTLAEVTFYGRDQVGNEVQATGTISVNFADFGDPS